MPQIGFRFHDEAGTFAVGEDFAEEVRGDFDGGAGVEDTGQDHVFLLRRPPVQQQVEGFSYCVL